MPNETNRKTAFMAIFSYAKPYRLTFGLIFGCILLSIMADLLQPYLVKLAIDNDLANHRFNLQYLLTIGVIYIILSMISFIFSYIQNNLLQYAGQNIIAAIRKSIFEKITTLSMGFFDRNPIGSLVTNISNDTETLSQFFTQVLLSFMRDTTTLVLIIVFLFQLD